MYDVLRTPTGFSGFESAGIVAMSEGRGALYPRTPHAARLPTLSK